MKQDKSKYTKYSNINLVYSNYWKQRTMRKSFRKLEKQKTTYRGTNLRITADFLSDTMQTRSQKETHFKMLNGEKKHSIRILYKQINLSYKKGK